MDDFGTIVEALTHQVCPTCCAVASSSCKLSRFISTCPSLASYQQFSTQ